MLFGTAPRLSAVNSFSITLNNNVIKRVFHFTYLGIVFDDRLSWNEQIKYLISKAGKRVQECSAGFAEASLERVQM